VSVQQNSLNVAAEWHRTTLSVYTSTTATIYDTAVTSVDENCALITSLCLSVCMFIFLQNYSKIQPVVGLKS